MTKPNIKNQPNNNEDKSWNELDKGEKILASTVASCIYLFLFFGVYNVFTKYPGKPDLQCEVLSKPFPTAITKKIKCTRQEFTQEFVFKDLLGSPTDNVQNALNEVHQSTPTIIKTIRFSEDKKSMTLETPLNFDIKIFEKQLGGKINVSNSQLMFQI
jgi:hypothetical protein